MRPLRWTLAIALLALAWMIVGYWRIGPVVLVLTATHGVHTGDSLAALPTALAAWLVRPGPQGRPAGRGSRRARTATSTILITATAAPHQG